MLLGVVSDTHGRIEAARRAVDVLRREGVDAVIHCGDIGSPAVPALFSEWPTKYVVGNVDDDDAALEQAIIAAGGEFCGFFGELERDHVRLAFLHSHEPGRLMREIASGEWDAICYGHTHQAEMHYVGKSLVINPGAVYRASPPQIATIELPSLTAGHHRLS